jgi:hypothetical protein
MKQTLLFVFTILIAITVISGCNKSGNNHTGIISSGDHYWMGTTSNGNEYCYDAFLKFPVMVIDENRVVVYNDTLTYDKGRSSSGQNTFFHQRSTRNEVHSKTLSVNTSNGNLAYSSSDQVAYGGGSMDLSTDSYHTNNALGSYLHNIVGTRSMSGTRIDTYPPDTVSLSGNVTFTSQNDVEISFSSSVTQLLFSNGTLHYKYTDADHNTVVFQTLHSYNSTCTLTYNYATNQLVFEQYSGAPPYPRHIVLQ